MRLRAYVSGTQRGYEAGLCDETGKRYTAVYFSKSTFGEKGAYYRASLSAAAAEHTWKRRPDLIKRSASWMPERLPGSIY